MVSSVADYGGACIGQLSIASLLAMWCRFLPLAALLSLLLAVAWGAEPVVTRLDLSGEVSRLTHLQVSPDSGQVYVAGVNRIYQLSSTLARLQEVVTGPRQDSPLCPASGCGSGVRNRAHRQCQQGAGRRPRVADTAGVWIGAAGRLHQIPAGQHIVARPGPPKSHRRQ